MDYLVTKFRIQFYFFTAYTLQGLLHCIMISERLRALKCYLVLLLVLLLLVEAGQGGLHVVRQRLRPLLGLEGRRWGHLTNTVMIFLEDNGFNSF